MNIAVLIRNNTEKVYMWVDTVVIKDEFDVAKERPIAILVDCRSGRVISKDIDDIQVISKDIVD